jgi:internalin A
MNASELEAFESARRWIGQQREKGRSVLYLNDWGLTRLPPEIGDFPSLEELQLAGNKLRELPREIGNLPKLQKLNLEDNQLQYLPKEIGQLEALTWLNLSDNQLTGLPAEIGALFFLSKLYLFRNKLAQLPREIGELSCLEELYLLGNQLTAIPAEIGELQLLRILNLAQNDLAELPAELGNLTSLTQLYLHGNPGLGMPAEKLGPTSPAVFHDQVAPGDPEKILSFYYKSRPQPLLEARIIVIGDGGVGKTSLVRQLVYGERAKEGEKSTRRVVITPWTRVLRGERVGINVWDFGGQEHMHAAHPYFFTERALYVVVVSVRDAGVEERIEHWLRMVGRYGRGAAAIIVVNKVDEYPMDVDRRRLCLTYGFLPDDPKEAFLPTSCITGQGIGNLREVIDRQLNAMEQIWARIPREYFNVKTQLLKIRDEGKDILNYDEWSKVCADEHIFDARSRDELLDLLGNLGLVVSFSDVKLHHLRVLNPEWVVEAIYPLRTSSELGSTEGLLTASDMERVLPRGRYPKETYGWIIQLMEAFELLFADSHGRHLMPMRLPKETPDWAQPERWSREDTLNVELRYDFLPESVISRFIVRKHSRALRPSSWWRFGMALKEYDCEALVRADIGERRVQLYINGPKLKRQGFLHSLRADFRSLSETISTERLWIVLPNGHYENYDELIDFAREGYLRIPRRVNERVVQVDIASILDLIEPRERASNPLVEVHVGDKVRADHGGTAISKSKLGDVTTIWSQQVSSGVSTSQLAEELSRLREAVRSHSGVPDVERDVVVGKLASAESAAKTGDGPAAVTNLKGISKWVLDVATKIGTSVAAKVIESAMNL